jgi:DNA-binding transcriptional regulator Cro
VTPKQVKEYYGSQYNFRKVTGMATATLGNWLKWGFVPENAQYKLERLTQGELKTEWTKGENSK